MTRTASLRRLLAGVAGAGSFTLAAPALADASAPDDVAVDVEVPETPPVARTLAVEWNPLALFTIGKLSANVIVVVGDHHAIILSPFYASTTTQPIDVFGNLGNATQLPQQKFSGFGGEIGYRYYTGKAGPRGFFVGPSILLGAMTATPQNGGSTGYFDYGLAVDAGYSVAVADRIALSLGVGVQYTTPDTSIPSQQFPADIYANAKVLPRALASIGWVF